MRFWVIKIGQKMGKIGIITHKTDFFEKKWIFFVNFWNFAIFCPSRAILNFAFFCQKSAIFGPKPPGVVQGCDPLKNPFFGVFWKSGKKPSFLALNLGHLKKAKKKGHFWVFQGGSKWPFLEKLKFYYVVDDVFFDFFRFFLCFFGHFCQFFGWPWFAVTLDHLCFTFLEPVFFHVFFMFFIVRYQFGAIVIKKGSKKWSKRGQKGVKKGSFWTPFFGVYPLIHV